MSAPVTADAPLWFQTAVDEAEAAFVRRLGDRLRGGAGGPEASLAGEGFNNWIWRLETRDGTVAVKVGKPHRGAEMTAEYAKEMWCAEAARAVGVATPAILAVGAFEGRAYQVQAFAPGRMPRAEEHRAVWAAMGRWARAIHDIPVAGWGRDLARPGVFDGSWRAHVEGCIASLTPDDPLLAMGVLTREVSADLRRRFEGLAARDFRMGLTHADFATWNVLVDDADGGTFALIDWGCAGAAPVPHHEIGELIRSERATPENLDIFRRAYGLSDAGFADLTADLPDLLAMRELDVLRWGLTARPHEIDKLTQRARRALARLAASPDVR